jgi:hypothetical protein
LAQQRSDESALSYRESNPLIGAPLSVAASDPQHHRFAPEQNAPAKVFCYEALDAFAA